MYGLFTLRGKDYTLREGDEVYFVVHFHRHLKKGQYWWDFPDDQIVQSFSIMHGRQKVRVAEGRLNFVGNRLYEAVGILSDTLCKRIEDPDPWGRSTIVKVGRMLIITRQFTVMNGYLYPWT